MLLDVPQVVFERRDFDVVFVLALLPRERLLAPMRPAVLNGDGVGPAQDGWSWLVEVEKGFLDVA